MVGLSVVLEGHNPKSSAAASKKSSSSSTSPQVINKATMSMAASINRKPTPLPPPSTTPTSSPSPSSSSRRNPSAQSRAAGLGFPAPAFLDQCCLCNSKLLPGKDIYMYKGDRAFCSVECRCRQIFMDEEETLRRDNCSMAATNPNTSSSSSSSSSSSRQRKGTRNTAGGFAF